jgi:hypothetical protein
MSAVAEQAAVGRATPAGAARVRRADALRLLAPGKVAAVVAVYLWINVPYYALQRFALFPATIMAPTALDDRIPFTEGAVWLYLSLFLLIPLAPLFVAPGPPVGRYVAGVAAIGLVSHLCFLFWPTAVARPAVAAPGFPYAVVVGADRPVNAYPSLHASLAVYSALWGHALLRGARGAAWWRAGLWAWTLAVLYGALAIRQHVVTDLLAGAALGTAVFACVGRPPGAARPAVALRGEENG